MHKMLGRNPVDPKTEAPEEPENKDSEGENADSDIDVEALNRLIEELEKQRENETKEEPME